MPISLNLYSTSHCHLCEEAKALLTELSVSALYTNDNFNWFEVEISEDSVLLEQYGLKIPVIKRLDINQELSWPFGTADIQKLISLQVTS